MGARSKGGGLCRFARYEETADFSNWHGMALASIVPPGEKFVLGIDCTDRWLFTKWGTKLVLTDKRVVAFTADPANPMKRTHWLEDILEVKYKTGLFTDELRFIGAGSYESYSVPKHLGREFVTAVEGALAEEQSETSA